MIYECMCQVSLGLKEDEEGSQAPPTALGSYFPVQNWLFSTLLGLLLRNKLLCQEAASSVINVYVIYKYVASLTRIERG